MISSSAILKMPRIFKSPFCALLLCIVFLVIPAFSYTNSTSTLGDGLTTSLHVAPAARHVRHILDARSTTCQICDGTFEVIDANVYCASCT
jgi:hypothetical protein